MPQVLRETHIVCFPSTYGEGVPKILIEAAASGKPIVATDIPGCREVVRHEESGYLVPPGEHGALVNALAELIGDAAKRKAMGLRGRELFERTFAMDQVIAATLAVYREALRE
jgi:glycosyltransferase involved in cell wall biosynthesis